MASSGVFGSSSIRGGTMMSRCVRLRLGRHLLIRPAQQYQSTVAFSRTLFHRTTLGSHGAIVATNGILPHRYLLSSSSSSSSSLLLSSNTSTTTRTLSNNNNNNNNSTTTTPTFVPPTSLTWDMARGVQAATLLYLEHGLGRRRLNDVAEDSTGDLVTRWRFMMEAFLGTQVHVLAGLGYEASERGIALYNQHLAELMRTAPPDEQEVLRLAGRDSWRRTLCLAFGLEKDDDGNARPVKEVSIVEARNIMHKVSQRMQEPQVLAKITKLANDKTSDDITKRHTAVQQVLVEDVYLGSGDGDDHTKSLVEECGFGSGEMGYVRMQCTMAEHQNDPLVAQYVGSAMQKVLQAAGIDLSQQSRQ